MAIAYSAAGTGATTEASGGDLAPTCPATVNANDILIAHVGYEGTTTAPSTPTGWTLLAGPFTIETAHRHWVFGKLAVGTEDGAAISFGTPAVTTMRTGRIYSFTGYVSGTIGQICHFYAHISHATDPQMPTVTTSLAGGLAVACIFQLDDNATGSATGETGGDWTEAVAEYTQSATTPDSGLSLQTCTPTANPGTVTGGTISTTDDPCGVIAFAIEDRAWSTLAPTVTGQSSTSVTEGTRYSVAATVGALSTTAAPVTLIEGGDIYQNAAEVGGQSVTAVSLAAVYGLAADAAGVAGAGVAAQSVLGMVATVDAQSGTAADGGAIRPFAADVGALSSAEVQVAGVYAMGAEVQGQSQAAAEIVLPVVYALNAEVAAQSDTSADLTLAVAQVAGGGDFFGFTRPQMATRYANASSPLVLTTTARATTSMRARGRASLQFASAGRAGTPSQADTRSMLGLVSGGAARASVAARSTAPLAIVGGSVGASQVAASTASPLAMIGAGIARGEARAVALSVLKFTTYAAASAPPLPEATHDDDEDVIVLAATMLLRRAA